jgi:hypothetical protein
MNHHDLQGLEVLIIFIILISACVAFDTEHEIEYMKIERRTPPQ